MRFTAPCYALAWSFCRPVSDHSFLRLSDTLVYCINMVEGVKLLSPPGRHIGLVFDSKRRYPTSRGAKYTGVGKFCHFRLKSPLSWKRYEIGPWLLWNVNRKSQMTDSSVSVPMTLNDSERRDEFCKIFSRISLITFVPFDLKRPNWSV